MNTGTLIFCSVLAVFAGILTQQGIQTLINTYLTLLPFAIHTVK